MKYIVLFFIFCAVATACRTDNGNRYEPFRDEISSLAAEMSSVMIHDITNPPLAARFFAYTFLAGYEVISQNDTACKSMYGIVNKYPAIRKPAIQEYNYRIASLFAMLETAKKIQPSGALLNSFQQNMIDSFLSNGVSREVVDSSHEYGLQVAKEILAYARSDGYRNISDYPRYVPVKGDGHWFPTPPGFFAAAEPYFNKIRPFLLDSCSQFAPAVPALFSQEKNTAFYALMDSVYETRIHLSDTQRTIASFWDCNPFAMEDEGHLRVGIKKISPGAHWIGIAGIACKKANLSFNKTMQLQAMLSVTLMDAFVSCWNEKYRSNRIRPETVIRRYIDASWSPLLQTPPFPEYPSGHSVVSAASAEILTHFLGDPFSYTDDVEINFGLPPRSFSSFRGAAAEAGMSRYYGGIHFPDAVNEGLKQGRLIGDYAVHKFAGF